jgi:hypothetical protein
MQPEATLALSDWVLVGTTLFLGTVALLTAIFGPTWSEKRTRRVFAPKINIVFKPEPPFCHQTFFGSPSHGWPVLFLRFMVVNEGKSLAKNCEALLEGLWTYDAAGKPHKVQDFRPVNLAWTGRLSNRPLMQFRDVNPKRWGVYCDIGYISSPEYQSQKESRERIGFPDNDANALRLMLGQAEDPFSQPNSLPPGKYAIQVTLHSENAEHRTVFFEIVWSGRWRNAERDMLQEVVVALAERLP